jgi:hypothetical protein
MDAAVGDGVEGLEGEEAPGVVVTGMEGDPVSLGLGDSVGSGFAVSSSPED